MHRAIICTALACVTCIVHAITPSLLNHDVTPATLDGTICTAGYTKSVRPSVNFTNGIKKKLMQEQGMNFNADKNNFELDHIIPLALGGHPRNRQNLMLQAWEGSEGAKRKDRLEVKLQCLVCSGQVPLDVAQDAIWTDWKVAYSMYGGVPCQRKRGLKSDAYGDN